MLKIPLTRPYIPTGTLEAVRAVLESGHLTEGSVTRRFEEAFAAFTGVPHAVACTSCTDGLELVLRAMEIGPGDEVIVPDYTYPATAQAVMLTGATAVIVDCDPATLNVDYNAMEAAVTSRTRAFMPVSLFGNPLNWDRLNALSRKCGLPVVEDAACALGSAYKGRRTGSYGLASVFSLHPRKSITTGEGGMIITGDDALASRLRSVKRFGLDRADGKREELRFVRLGANAKMSDIVAAVGLAQLAEAENILARRKELAARYDALLADAAKNGRLRFPRCTSGGTHAYQSYCVLMPERDHVLRSLRAQGIEAQIGTYALHREPLFQTHPLCRLQGAMPGSREAYEKTLTLPLFHAMTDAEQQETVKCLTALLLNPNESIFAGRPL